MSSERAYFNDLAKLNEILDASLAGDANLPDELQPENQVVSESIKSRAAAMREAVLRGDRESARSCGKELAASGFDRSQEDEGREIDELQEAKERAKQRRLGEIQGGPQDEAAEDPGSSGDSSP